MFGRNLVDRRDDFGGLNGVGPDLAIVLGGSSRGCVLWSTGFAAGGAGDVVVGRSLHTHTHCGSAVLGFNHCVFTHSLALLSLRKPEAVAAVPGAAVDLVDQVRASVAVVVAAVAAMCSKPVDPPSDGVSCGASDSTTR